MKQDIMGWRWYQLDHMQMICTSFPTDNHACTSSLSFYRPDALTAAQPTASMHTHAHTTILRLYGFCPRQPGWVGTRRIIHPASKHWRHNLHTQ